MFTSSQIIIGYDLSQEKGKRPISLSGNIRIIEAHIILTLNDHVSIQSIFYTELQSDRDAEYKRSSVKKYDIFKQGCLASLAYDSSMNAKLVITESYKIHFRTDTHTRPVMTLTFPP